MPSTLTRTLGAAALAVAAAASAAAADLEAVDAYARSANPMSGAAFMTLRNATDADERLVEARADVAERVELHTHVMEDGVARMRRIDGIDVPAGGEARLERRGLHVMFLGLTRSFDQGDSFPLELVFESGRTLEVEVTVDNERMPAGMGMRHGQGMRQGQGGQGMGQGQGMRQGQGMGQGGQGMRQGQGMGQGGQGQGQGMRRPAPDD